MNDATLPPSYFEQLYAEADDPWRISQGWYEQRKRDITVHALPRPHFGSVFEPGCSNGELTERLAPRCDRLVAWDVVPAAVARTRARTAQFGHVSVERGGLPDFWPDGHADLVVLSEIGYYLGEADLRHVLDMIVRSLGDDGTLLAVHWRRDAPDYPLTGDRVHELVNTQSGFQRVAGYRDDDFVLDVLVTGDTRSVAQRSGVV